MRLAFIFCFVSTSLFSQSLEFRVLYPFFNSSLEEADAILQTKGYTFELDKNEKPIDDVGYVWSRDVSWVNRQGVREFWKYYCSASRNHLGIYRKSGAKSFTELAWIYPELDTAAILKEIQDMGVKGIPDHPEPTFLSADRSFVVHILIADQYNIRMASIIRKGTRSTNS